MKVVLPATCIAGSGRTIDIMPNNLHTPLLAQLLTSRGNALFPYANVVRDGSISGGYFADITVPAIFPGHTSCLTKKTNGFSLI